ncbi:MAG: hypothetical protein ABI658_01350 [Acidimicrobiales bacterium]
MGFVVIFVVAVLVGAVLWYLQTVALTRRRKRMSEVAARHGLSFSAKDPFRMPVTLPLAFFDRGHSRKASNVMYGRTADGHDRRAFDYQYTTGSGKNRRVYNYSCGLISTGAQWPQLTLGPEGFFERVLDVVGGADIQFESEEFNRVWEVRSSDSRFASALIDPEMMLFLMEKAEGARIEVHGPWILFSGEQRDPDSLPQAITVAEAFREGIPPVVWSLYPPPDV